MYNQRGLVQECGAAINNSGQSTVAVDRVGWNACLRLLQALSDSDKRTTTATKSIGVNGNWTVRSA
jgi:hypothetical protein